MKKKTYNMLTDPPGRSLLLFALPMILGNLFQQFYNIADSVIGKSSKSCFSLEEQKPQRGLKQTSETV